MILMEFFKARNNKFPCCSFLLFDSNSTGYEKSVGHRLRVPAPWPDALYRNLGPYSLIIPVGAEKSFSMRLIS